MDGTWWQAAAAIGMFALIPIGWLIFALSRLKNDLSEQKAQVAALLEWKTGHEYADQRTHARLEDGDREVLMEIRALRTESGEQHRELATKVETMGQRGDAGRAKLHESLNELRGQVQRLMGRAEEQDRLNKA